MDFIQYLADKHNIRLNTQQQQAVLHIDGPVLLLAVPGGGKTTVIVSRCANMVINHKISPSSILTLTFSKASALDMERRFQAVFGEEVSEKLHFSTIHSFCFGVLRTYMNQTRQSFPAIIEDEAAPVTRSQLLKQLNLQINNTYLTEDKQDELSNAICYVKNMMLNDEQIEDYEEECSIEKFRQIYRGYESCKKENNYIDYDDMLTITLELFHQNPGLIDAYRRKYKYINVDESQDTSLLQHRIIQCLANPVNNIFMVGDEDQSIYTFRAAFPKALLDFRNTYPGAQVYLMENNYRSTRNIVSAANQFIKQNRERYNKNMFCEKEEGIPANYTFLKEKNDQYVYLVTLLQNDLDFAGTAILYRNNVSAIPVADVLERNGIAFYIREAKNHFFKHWVTTDILAFLALALDGSDMEAFRQIYYKINAYISKSMLEFAAETIQPGMNVFDVLLKYPDIHDKLTPRIIEVKNQIAQMQSMNVFAAIIHIVDGIGYGEYVKKRGSEDANSADSLTQIIGSLKSIAMKTSDIRDFRERLVMLQHIMDGARFNKGKNAVTLSTIHSSKGLEFDRVCMIDLFDGQFPSQGSIKAYYEKEWTAMEEEVRLFYVGVTRAKKQLELISADMVDGKKARPSRFIEQFMSVYKKKKKEEGKNRLESVKKLVKTAFNRQELDTGRFIDKGDVKDAAELSMDAQVWHSRFGAGFVRFINPQFDLLEIHFESAGKKTLSLKACVGAGILHVVDEKPRR